MFVIGIAIIFRCRDLVNGSEMVDLLKATTIAFFSANGLEHIMTVVKGGMDAKAAALSGADQNLAPVDDDDDDEEDKEEPKKTEGV